MKYAFYMLFAFAAHICSAAKFDVVLMDDPAIRLTFDRKYDVNLITKTNEKLKPGCLMYLMLPEDGQSAVTLAIGDSFQVKTEKDIAEMCEGAKVTKVDGAIGQYPVQWWHYRDSQHLYSTCVIKVKWRDKPQWPVVIDLIANSQERLASLETSFSKIQMIENPPNKAPVPTATSVTPAADAPVAPAGAAAQL